MLNFKETRVAAGKTQLEVAIFLGITRPAYSRYESGEREPDNNMLSKIADYFGVTTDYLLGRTNIKETASNEIVDDDIKFALFGTTDIDDELYEDVKRIAKIQMQLKEEKEKARLLKEKADN